MVLSDLALGGGAILSAPEDTLYIFDEGHHLPDKALSHFSNSTRYRSTIRWLGQSEGQWPKLLEPVEKATYFCQIAEPLESRLKSVRTVLEEGLHLIHDVTAEVDTSQQSPSLRFEQGVVPPELEALAQRARSGFAELVSLLEKMYRELETLLDEEYSAVPKVDLENIFPVIGSWLARADASLELWASYSHTQPDEKWPLARWITIVTFNESSDFELVSSPILASRTLRKDLWSRCAGAVVTSATLTALNSFDRFKMRAGTYDDSHYAVVPSPFDYANRAKLVIPDGSVDANISEPHTESIIEILPNIVDRNEGTLVLFSSRRQLNDVFDGLPHDLRKLILMQGIESKQALVKKHKLLIDDG